MAIAMTLISCSGDDGSDGVNGINGIDGTNGANGQNGANGVDGQDGINAQKIIVDMSKFGSGETSLEIIVPELTNEVILSNTIIYFLEALGGDETTYYYAVPGRVEWLDRQFEIAALPGGVIMHVSDFDGNNNLDSGWVPDIFSNLNITLIKNTTLQGKSQENVMATLKANGVDITNYHEVMQYLGLE